MLAGGFFSGAANLIKRMTSSSNLDSEDEWAKGRDERTAAGGVDASYFGIRIRLDGRAAFIVGGHVVFVSDELRHGEDTDRELTAANSVLGCFTGKLVTAPVACAPPDQGRKG